MKKKSAKLIKQQQLQQQNNDMNQQINQQLITKKTNI